MNPVGTINKTETLAVGFGSPHGDDQAGWKVINQLEHLKLPGIKLRQATVPHDFVDWLDEQNSLHLVDGCITNGRDSDNLNYQRFELVEDANQCDSRLRFTNSSQHPSATAVFERPIQLRSAGSHQIDLFTVLELAACLGRLPKHVVLWAIPGQQFSPGNAVSDSCESAIANCVERLAKELGHA